MDKYNAIVMEGKSMGFFNELSDSIVNTTKDLGKMAQNATDATKMSYDKKVKEAELSKLYEKLGRKYYESHKDEESEDILAITAAINKIQELSNDILEKKGAKPCPKCGAVVKDGASFCSNCGEKIGDFFEE